jgi:hypothetical protein
MKRSMMFALGTVVLSAALAGSVHAENPPPGQVDFGTFSPPTGGGEFVEVNVTSSLISIATKFIEKSEPEVAKVLNGLQSVRVNVVGMDDDNRGELEKRVQTVRQELEKKGWERLVIARQKDQDVGVYLKTANKDTVQGLVVVVMDGNKQAVFVNVVGDIKPEQLAMIGERLHIEPLKHLGTPAEK